MKITCAKLAGEGPGAKTVTYIWCFQGRDCNVPTKYHRVTSPPDATSRSPSLAPLCCARQWNTNYYEIHTPQMCNGAPAHSKHTLLTPWTYTPHTTSFTCPLPFSLPGSVVAPTPVSPTTPLVSMATGTPTPSSDPIPGMELNQVKGHEELHYAAII